MVSDDEMVEAYLRLGSIRATTRELRVGSQRLSNILASRGILSPQALKRKGILSPQRLAQIKQCPDCGHTHIFPVCEWCYYLFQRDELDATDEAPKPKKARYKRKGYKRRNWMHNPNPWND